MKEQETVKTPPQMICNNLVWKFNKNHQEPIALLRTRDHVVLGSHDYYLHFPHFRPMTMAEEVDFINIQNSKVLSTTTPKYMNTIHLNLIDPVGHDKPQLVIYCISCEEDENMDFKDNFFDGCPKELRDYFRTVGIILARKINNCIEDRYKELSFLQKLKYKVCNVKYPLMDDLPLSEWIPEIMNQNFYVPAKNDPKISAKMVDPLTLIFSLQ